MKIAPSILSADFARLADEIKDVERGGADWIHVDVMDGHFVPNITIGPLIVEAIRPHTDLPLDVHLMIENPDQYIPVFAKKGADVITVHQEAAVHLHRTIYHIKDQGVKAGVAINPATPISVLEDTLVDVDMVLIMTVNPGFGGQSFIPQMTDKIRRLKKMLEQQGHQNDVIIEVDGGISAQTAAQVVEAGASVLVAGSAIFNEKDRAMAIENIRKSAVIR